MLSYDTLSQAVNDLQHRGYTDELMHGGHCVISNVKCIKLDPADFEIDEFHRFEGNSDPEDQSIVYAISSAKHGIKGLLINAYGVDATSLTNEMVAKLSTHPTP